MTLNGRAYLAQQHWSNASAGCVLSYATKTFWTLATHAPLSFTDDPLVSGTTPGRAVHVSELRQRINGIRVSLGLTNYSFSDPILTPGLTSMRSVHIAELRAARQDAYDAAGLLRPVYTDPTVTVGTVIKAVHITELRNALRVIE